MAAVKFPILPIRPKTGKNRNPHSSRSPLRGRGGMGNGKRDEFSVWSATAQPTRIRRTERSHRSPVVLHGSARDRRVRGPLGRLAPPEGGIAPFRSASRRPVWCPRWQIARLFGVSRARTRKSGTHRERTSNLNARNAGAAAIERHLSAHWNFKMSTVATLIAELKVKLGDRARDELDRLVASPEGQALLDRDEAVLIAERKTLVTRLVACPAKYAAAQAAAARLGVTAAKVLAEAESALHAARDGYAEACRVTLSADVGEANERHELERALRELADPRLAELAGHCDELAGVANSCFAHRPVASRDWATGRITTETVTNRAEVLAAREALRTVGADALRLQLEALATHEITERIQAHLLALEPLLGALGMLVLTIDEAGRLKRERIVPNRILANRAIRAAGGASDVADELPTYDRAPNLHRAQKALGLLA